MNRFFFNQLGHLRSGWRFAVFLFLFTFLSLPVIWVSMAALKGIPDGTNVGRYAGLIVPFLMSTALAAGLAAVLGKVFEKVDYRSFGFSLSLTSARNFVWGGVVGAIAIITAIYIAFAGGGFTISVNRSSTGTDIASSFALTLLIFFASAASEETLFRGYILQTFVRGKLPIVGVVLPSLLFAFAHANNPDATSLGLVNTFLAGIWFGFAYLKTRDIWFPFGIHLLWNFLQGPFFGINVSGIREFSPAPVFSSVDNGPVWLTGGAYGIEGGLACTAAILLSIGAIYYMPKPEARDDLVALTSNEGPPAREIILSGS